MLFSAVKVQHSTTTRISSEVTQNLFFESNKHYDIWSSPGSSHNQSCFAPPANLLPRPQPQFFEPTLQQQPHVDLVGSQSDDALLKLKGAKTLKELETELLLQQSNASETRSANSSRKTFFEQAEREPLPTSSSSFPASSRVLGGTPKPATANRSVGQSFQGSHFSVPPLDMYAVQAPRFPGGQQYPPICMPPLPPSLVLPNSRMATSGRNMWIPVIPQNAPSVQFNHKSMPNVMFPSRLRLLHPAAIRQGFGPPTSGMDCGAIRDFQSKYGHRADFAFFCDPQNFAEFNRLSRMRSFDPYAELMTRRERSWLIRISLVQLQNDCLCSGDSYYTMLCKKRNAENSLDRVVLNSTCDDHEHAENGESRVYVPPQFDHALGRIQVVSANSPRPMIQLCHPDANAKGCLSLHFERSLRISSGYTKLKCVLLDVENIYCLLLKCEELLKMAVQQHDTIKSRDKMLHQLVQYFQNPDVFSVVMSIAKAKRLLGRAILLLSDTSDLLDLLCHFLRNLEIFNRKDVNSGLFDAVFVPLCSKMLIGLTSDSMYWPVVLREINVHSLNSCMKTKFSYALLLLCAVCSSRANALVDDASTALTLQKWATLFFSAPQVLSQKEYQWLSREDLLVLVNWIAKTRLLQCNKIDDLLCMFSTYSPASAD
ncbi:unnamed protein product [Soboliphyme baturini]|uniref:mRNA decay factor PAT1 domain-containing protein n=1 Tax=Soboliphyme baturini TaxID=241478 RepID=A0A3P8A8A4_9BILA|nr:unnamed protein product [Soboliphyme baturini]